MADPLAEFDAQVRALVEKGLATLAAPSAFTLETPPPGVADRGVPCFQFAKPLRQPPTEIATRLAEAIRPRLGEANLVARCEAASAYVNFWVDKATVARRLLPAVLSEREAFGSLPPTRKKLTLEHTSANPNGPLHVGRARNPIIGDTLVRIMRKAGWTVEAQYYLDDLGKQVAILAWGLQNLQHADLEPAARPKRDHDLVRFYQEASRRMQGDQKVQDEIQELVQRSEEGVEATLNLFTEAYKPVLEGMMDSLLRIGVTFDSVVKESQFVINKDTDKIVERLERTPLSRKETDGALYLDLAQHGIHGRSQRFVYRRRDGTSLYATRDVAYHFWKSTHADRLINVLGEDHKLQAQQVRICLELLGCKVVPEVVFYAFVSLPEGKMSTRKNRVVFLDDLIDEAVDRAYEEVKKRRGGELMEDQLRTIANSVGVGALRYNIVRVQPEKGITFRWEEALNFEGSSAPFLQYSYARCASILRKAAQSVDAKAPPGGHASELELLHQIARLPRVVEEAAASARPHVVASYAQDLANAVSSFYRDCPVLNAEDAAVRSSRLAEVEAARLALRNTMQLLGVPVLEEM